MQQRLDYSKASPEGVKAMLGIGKIPACLRIGTFADANW